MNVTVIGGSGFVGTRLCRRLATNPKVGQFLIVDKAPSRSFPENAMRADVRSLSELRSSIPVSDVLINLAAEHKDNVTPRSLRMRPSGIAGDHPLVIAAKKLGLELYGSPTTSDQALIPVPSVKIGPGDSARSHSADEFIFVEEIRRGIETYIRLLDNLIKA